MRSTWPPKIPIADERIDKPRTDNREQTGRKAIARTILKYRKSCRQTLPASKRTSAHPIPPGSSRAELSNRLAGESLYPPPLFFLHQARTSQSYRESQTALP